MAKFDCVRRSWTPLATSRQIEDPVWSLDSQFVYFRASTEDGAALFRVRIADAAVGRIAPYPSSQIRWSGVGPDGSLLRLIRLRIEDIYAISFK